MMNCPKSMERHRLHLDERTNGHSWASMDDHEDAPIWPEVGRKRQYIFPINMNAEGRAKRDTRV